VARLAGLPQVVLERAREVLANLEREELSRDGRPKLARHLSEAEPAPGAPPTPPAQLGLFAPDEDPVLLALRSAPLDRMSPLEALNLLARLQGRLAGTSRDEG